MRSVIRWIVFILTILVPAGAAWAEPNIHDTRLLTQPAVERPARGVRLRRQPVDRRHRRQERPAADRRRGGHLPGLFAGRSDDCLQRPIRREHRRLHDSGQRRLADPADLAPGAGHRPRLHARRPSGAVRLAAAGLHAPLHAIVHGAARRAGCRRNCRSPTRPKPASRPTDSRSPIRRWPTAARNGSTIAAARTRESGSSTATTIASRKSPSRSPAATTSTRTGSAKWSISAPTATASSTCSLSTPTRKPSSNSPGTPISRWSTWARAAAGSIYEQAGYLHLFDPAAGTSTRLRIGVATDLVELAAALPEGRGEVHPRRGHFTQRRPGRVRVPRRDRHRAGRKGRSAQPDRIAGGQRSLARLVARRQVDRLVLRRRGRVPAPRQAGRRQGAAQSYDAKAPASTPAPSGRPTARRSLTSTIRSRSSGSISAADTSRRSPRSRSIGRGDGSTLRPAWSPDSKWIVYALGNSASYHTIYAYELARRSSRAITDGLSDAVEPVFDADGKYLYFFASTDAGPVNQWFEQSAEDMRSRCSIYLVVLRRGVPSPLTRESDEEKPADKAEKSPPGDGQKAKIAVTRPPTRTRMAGGAETHHRGEGRAEAGRRSISTGIDDRIVAIGRAGRQLLEPPAGAGGQDVLPRTGPVRPTKRSPKSPTAPS